MVSQPNIQDLTYSVDVLRTILWQYDSAPNIVGLLKRKQLWYDENHTLFWEEWYRDVYNLSTVSEFGATVWSIILNIPLIREAGKSPSAYPAWGYEGDGAGGYLGALNFKGPDGTPDASPPSNFGTNASSGIHLTLEQKRFILQLRYFRLVNKGNAPDINEFIGNLFKDFGFVYVEDNLDMTLDYVFDFPLPQSFLFVLDQFDVLPRPAGVGVRRTSVISETWGFEATHENFDHGGFKREL